MCANNLCLTLGCRGHKAQVWHHCVLRARCTVPKYYRRSNEAKGNMLSCNQQ